MDPRVPHSFGSVILLTGAFAIGWALHQSLVTGNAALTDPAPVGAIALGVALLAVGRRIERRFDPSEFVRDVEDEDEEDEDGAFDEAGSPLQEEWMEGHDRDDSYEG